MSKFIKKYRQAIITVIVIAFLICAYKAAFAIADVMDLHLYFGWQEVELGSMTLKVPGEWEKHEKNGLLYFTFHEQKPKESIAPEDDSDIVFFQSNVENMYELGYKGKLSEDSEESIVGDDFRNIVSVSGSVNSLGQIDGEAIVSVDDIMYKKSYIVFNDHDKDYSFYIWNSNVDDETIDKIADSVSFNDQLSQD